MGRAGVSGPRAMPKGIRHSFGVASYQTVRPHLVQRWLGHGLPRTTAIYGDVMGPEERQFAGRLWVNPNPLLSFISAIRSWVGGNVPKRRRTEARRNAADDGPILRSIFGSGGSALN